MECAIPLRRFFAVAPLLALAGIAAPSPARAEPVPQPAPIEQSLPLRVQQKSDGPAIAIPAPPTQRHPSDRRSFTLGAVNIDGATIFTEQQLSRYFEPYLATQIDSQRLAKIADAITARYRASGYLLSYAAVPAQDVQAGMVRLTIVEGRISSVSVDGVRPAAARAIKNIAEPLVRGGPLKKSRLERTIGLIRDFPGVKITDISIVRSDIAAGLYALKITAVPGRTSGLVYFDNRGTGSLGQSRLYGSVSFSSVAVEGDQLRLDLFAMPGRRAHDLYGEVLGAAPLGHSGMRLILSASTSNQYLQADTRFDCRTDNVSALVSYPLLRSRDLTILGKAGITDWATSGSARGEKLVRDRLRVARIGFEFSGQGKIRFQGELMVSQGISFQGMTRAGDPLATRIDAGGLFTKVGFSLEASRALSDLITLRTSLVGQYSDRPLLAEEEFSLGGSRVGRAFKFNELTGVRGIGGGLELSYRLQGPAKTVATRELFAFVDGGIAGEAGSSASPAQSHSLASAGLGTRFSFRSTTVSLEAAIPFRGKDHSPRYYITAFHTF